MRNTKILIRLSLLITASLFILVACSSSQKATDSEAVQTEATPTPPQQATQSSTDTAEPIQVFPTPTMEEGTIITESGLRFLDIAVGNGNEPETGHIVEMNVLGYLEDGTTFFDSYQQGETVLAILGRDQLLPGWEEGLRLMNTGGKAKLTLPPDLAFGETGNGIIPPNATVILEVELLSSEPPPDPFDVNQDDLTTTETGLQYYDITAGSGEEASVESIVSTHFTIWVKQDVGENTFILTSLASQPISFVVGRMDVVFPGWDEGVLNMKVGGKRLLIIPPDLALGESGGRDIPPNSTLIMEIELVSSREPVKLTVVDEESYEITESGLKFYDILEGTGETPAAGQTVVVHYTGWLEDGTQFDSSVDRNEPFSFQLGTGAVIAGWDEGVATMKVGGKRQLVIPPELGYGDSGAGNLIPPGAILIFDVELLDIQE